MMLPETIRRYGLTITGGVGFCAVLATIGIAGGTYVRGANPIGSAARLRESAAYQRPVAPPFPVGNAHSKARELLGKTLFFEPKLSASNWISCSSCHNPGLSWGDGLPTAIGHGMKVLGRRTPTILNLAWGDAMFWDGRADSLEDQATGPIAAAGEMNLPLPEMALKLSRISGYRRMFDRAYPGEGVTPKAVAKAIATFERTVVSADAPFDRWVKGNNRAIEQDAVLGFELFNGEARCSKCHAGWRFTDDSFHDIGMAGADVGRGAIVKGVPAMQYAFKTPTLRNVELRAPYMHDGTVATLDDVVESYDRGGDVKRPNLSPEIRPLHLSAAQKHNLVAFMKTLTSHTPVEVPVLPR
jgi:cytochrome c peroxidase